MHLCEFFGFQSTCFDGVSNVSLLVGCYITSSAPTCSVIRRISSYWVLSIGIPLASRSCFASSSGSPAMSTASAPASAGVSCRSWIIWSIMSLNSFTGLKDAMSIAIVHDMFRPLPIIELYPPPDSTPHSMSTITASPYPLCAPCSLVFPSGFCAQWSPLSPGGSVIGSPSAPTAHPSGIGTPNLLASPIFPLATVEVAMSNIKLFSFSAGAANAIGLVPSIGFLARAGLTAGPAFVIAMPIISFSSASMA